MIYLYLLLVFAVLVVLGRLNYRHTLRSASRLLRGPSTCNNYFDRRSLE